MNQTPEVDYEENDELEGFVDQETTTAEPKSTPDAMSDVGEGEAKQAADNASDAASEEDDYTPRERREIALAASIPGCDPTRQPWNMLMNERLDGKDGWSEVEWVSKFLEWRAIQGKRPVDEDEYKAVSASWLEFLSKALLGGKEAVESLMRSAKARRERDNRFSVTGIKKEVHDLCNGQGVVCRVLLYENICSECGYRGRGDPEFQKPVLFPRNDELEHKLRQYEEVLNERRVRWRRNFDDNSAEGRRAHPEREPSEVPTSRSRENSHASARGNTSREFASSHGERRGSHARESIQSRTGGRRTSRSAAAAVAESSDVNFWGSEEIHPLQDYDPEAKVRRLENLISKKDENFGKTVAVLESCVGAFASSLKQLTERCERMERKLKLRFEEIDGVLKTQHLKIQALETWYQEQRREAAKRKREGGQALGPLEAIRRRERRDPPDSGHPAPTAGTA